VSIDRLCELVRGRAVVVLTGAGLSTESGIPDYRSPQSLARNRRPIQGPEFARSELIRKRYWARSTLGWERMRRAEPNAGHLAIAALEHAGVVAHVITQNVDRLHHKAGSRSVTELHGALADVGCLDCGAVEDRDALQSRIRALNPGWEHALADVAPDGDAELPADRIAGFSLPSCARCGGVIKPRVVFFGDSVPRATVEQAFGAVDQARLLLVVGTSLAVYSGYRFARRAFELGLPVAIINRGPVRGEERAVLKLEASTGATLEALARQARAAVSA
jgi:NAD-dependent SIR2 family protein deacetylase